MPARTVEAAGGALWRPALGGSGIEVVLVHRPKYDDWSLPKGKLAAGEHEVLGAVREVWEETGFVGIPGRPLGQIRYFKDGEPKRVRYWSMRVQSGVFTPNEEVDQLMWLPPKEAQQHLHPERDRRILAEFERDTEATRAFMVVRHGSAGERASWRGDDRERPLDDVGHAQAQALVPLLEAYDIGRVLSADVLRCMDTVGPFAALRHVPVESEPLVSETGTLSNPNAAIERMLTLMGDPEPTAVCSQGKAIPELLAGVCRDLGTLVPPDTHTRKGGFWVLHLASNGKTRLAGIERFDPPAS